MFLKFYISVTMLITLTTSGLIPNQYQDRYKLCLNRAQFDVDTNKTPCTVAALNKCDKTLSLEAESDASKLLDCQRLVSGKYCNIIDGKEFSYYNCDQDLGFKIELECAYLFTGRDPVESYCDCTLINIQNCIEKKTNCDVLKSINAICSIVSNSNNLLSNIFGAPNGLETLGICSIDLLAASLAATLVFPPLLIPVSALRIACSAKLAGVSIRLLVEAADGICALAGPKLDTSQNKLCVYKRTRNIKTNYNHKKLEKRDLTNIIKTVRVNVLQEFNRQCKVIVDNDVSEIFEKETDVKMIIGLCKLTTEMHDAYENLTSLLTNMTKLPETITSTAILNPSQKAKL